MAGTSEPNATVARVDVALQGIEHAWLATRDGLATLSVAVAQLGAALAALKGAGFESATLVTAVDRLPRAPRFELVHQLHSLAHGARVRVKCTLAEGQEAPTCTHLWPGAAFMERECFDLFGIVFAGHAGLKRLLMPEGYEHHPLRKDFPHHGIEPDRLYREWDQQRRADWHPEGAR
ncbi:MAG TPA: NADH-quinone oxidoreductase subunit C [Planctomycetota bacterium]